MDIHISEESLPGIGRRYELQVDSDRDLGVIVEHRGARHIVVLGAGTDEPELAVRLSHEQAVALAALLIGARITMGTAEDDRIAQTR